MEIVLWIIYLAVIFPFAGYTANSLKRYRATGELDGLDYGVIGAMGFCWPLVIGLVIIIGMCKIVGMLPDTVMKGLFGK